MLRRSLRLAEGSVGAEVFGGKPAALRSTIRTDVPAMPSPSAKRKENALARLYNKIAGPGDREGGPTFSPMVHPDGTMFGDSKPPEAPYVPPLRREWKRAPLNRLTSERTRAEWFRFMQFNMMTDQWTPDKDTGAFTTPVADIDVKIPAFARPEHLRKLAKEQQQQQGVGAAASNKEEGAESAEPEAFSYDPKIDTDLPPFLNWDFRMKAFINEVRHYDPDVICVNEMNKLHFTQTMWPVIRYEGYGGLYVSSRGRKVKALKPINNPLQRIHADKVPLTEDIGNAIFFHRSRFVPMMLPGPETPRHLHFGIFAALRDTVSNLELFIANLQLTAGSTKEAALLREHECKAALTVIDNIVRHNSSRSHGTVMICGDLNNVVDDEPCVEMLRERFYSTYDVVGGPRWTAWYHQKSDQPNKYYANNLGMKNAVDGTDAQKKLTSATIKPQHMKDMVMGPSKAKQHAQIEADRLAREQKKEAAMHEPVVPLDEAAAGGDALVLSKVIELQKGIVHRTQDFIFYDPSRIGLLQVLDVPSDDQVDQKTLFPNRKNPSHHVSLMVDMAFHDINPDVLQDSLKP